MSAKSDVRNGLHERGSSLIPRVKSMIELNPSENPQDAVFGEQQSLCVPHDSRVFLWKMWMVHSLQFTRGVGRNCIAKNARDR